MGAQGSRGKKGMGRGSREKAGDGVLKGWLAENMQLKRKPRMNGWEPGIQVTRDRRIEPPSQHPAKEKGLENRKVRGDEKAKVKVRTAVSLKKPLLKSCFLRMPELLMLMFCV